jgi:hypothetical protein
MNMEKQTVFDQDISLFWHCEVRDQHCIADLKLTLASELHAVSAADFREMLAQAIREPRYTVQAYEALTGLDFESVTQVAEDLSELWRALYGTDIEVPK